MMSESKTIMSDELSKEFDILFQKIMRSRDPDYDGIFIRIGDLKTKVISEMAENRKVFDEKIKVLTDTTGYLDSYINNMIEFLKEINEYLNSNTYNEEAWRSILHKKIKEILKEKK